MIKMKKKCLIPVIFLVILALCVGAAHASGDLDNMSLEELQKLQEQLNQKISEKENETSPESPTEAPSPETTPVPITGIKIAAPKDPLGNGKELTLKWQVTVTPEEASRDGLEYTVSDESIAEITPEGNLLGKKAGTVTVTVTDPASGKKASAKFQVITLIEEIDENPRYINLFVGKSCKLNPIFSPENASNKKLTWESDNPEIAKVAANGTVTAVAPGSAYIKGRSQDGSFKVALYRVTVTVPMKKITLTLREKNYFTGEVKKTEYKVEPENTTNKNIDWVSSDPSVAEVNSYGTVSAKNPGKCTITGTAQDGGGAVAKFTVYVDPGRPMHIEMLNYRTTRNGKQYSFDAVSDCVRRKIEGFNYEIRCYDAREDIPTVSEYYAARRLDPGKKAATKWSTTSGFETADRVVVIVTGVFFTDGTSIRIDESDRQEITFHMN